VPEVLMASPVFQLVAILSLALLPPVYSISVLWIGNSYTYYNDLPTIVSKLAQAAGEGYEFDSHLEGGWSWEKHWNSNETLQKIGSKAWDVVVLQEYSTRPAYNEERVCRDTVTYLDNLVAKIKESSPEGRLQFYQTWGRPFGLASECPNLPQFCEYATMQDALTASYSTFACMKKPASVAPVGESFRQVRNTQGDEFFFSLYNTGGVSDHHPSLAGSYLSGLVHFLSLFPHSTVLGITETMGLDQATAAILQEAAEETWALGLPWTFPAGEECDLCMCNC